MSTCEPVSRDALLVDFQLIDPTVVASLRTLVIGLDYSVRKYSVPTLYNLIGAYDELTGVSAAWPNLAVNETVDLTTAELIVVQGLVNYFADTGVPGPTEGVQSGTLPNVILHDAGATIWAGPNRTVNVITDVVVGDRVLLTGVSTLDTTVAGFTYSLGNPVGLVLADNLPAGLTGGANFLVSLSQVVDTINLPAADMTLTSTTAQADPAITITTTRTGVPVPLIGGTGYSAVYTNYRAERTPATVGTILSITDASQLDALFVGWEYPESGLGFAIARALAPAQTPVIVLPAVLAMVVPTNTTSGWQDIINRVQRRSDWLAVCPLTTSPTILGLVETMITARATIGLNSSAFFCLELITETVILSGSGNTVLVDQSLTPGFDRTVIRDGGVANPFQNTVAGDIVQIAGVDYVVSAKISNQTVLIESSAVAGAGQTLNNIRHPLSPLEQADNYGLRAQAYANADICVVFPPNPTWETEVVDGYLLSAAVGGLRGYTIPQEGLRSVQLESGWGVSQSAYEFFPYLKLLADYGCFVLDTNDSLTDPGAIVLYPNTTDQTDTLTSREATVANVNAAKRFLQASVQCLVGRIRVTSQALDEIRVEVGNAINTLQNQTSVDPFGPVILTGSVGQPYQDPAQLDVVIVPVAITIAVGIEEITLEIVVTVATV